MKSSHDHERIHLPTFEQMMRAGGFSEQEGHDPGDPDYDEQEREEESGEVDRVKELCDNMIAQAITQSETILRQAREEAVAIAHKAANAGRAKAQEEMQEKRQQLEDAFLAATDTLLLARDQLYDVLEPYFLDTAIRMAESILRYEVNRADEAYLSIVHNVLEQAFMARNIVLHLPAGRFDALMAGPGGGLLSELERRGADVVRDLALDESDCMVMGDMGSIRGGAKTQIARLRVSLAEGGQGST